MIRPIAGPLVAALVLFSIPSFGNPPEGTPVRNGVPESNRDDFPVALALFEQGRYGDAIPRLEALLKRKSPLADHILIYLGSAREQSAMTNGARAAYQQVLFDFPKSVHVPGASTALGQFYLATGDLEGARGSFQMATNGPPAIALRAKLGLGEVARHKGQAPAAQGYWLEVRQAAPLSPEARDAKGRLRKLWARHPDLTPRGTNLLEEAGRLFSEKDYGAIARMAGPGFLAPPLSTVEWTDLWANTQVKLGDKTGALETLERLTAMTTNIPRIQDARFRRANIFWNMDRDDEALADFKKCLDPPGYPRGDEALYAIGRIHEQYLRTNDAIQTFRLLSQMKGPRNLSDEALWRIGWVHYRSGQVPSAIAAFAEAAARERVPAMATYWWARSLEKMGRGAEARVQYLRVRTADPSSLYALWAGRRMGMTLPPPKVPPSAVLAPASRAVVLDLPRISDPFHLLRAEELRRWGLHRLAVMELEALEKQGEKNPELQPYLTRAYLYADAIPDAARLAGTPAGGSSLTPAERLLLYYPFAHGARIGLASQTWGVDPFLIMGLIRQESAFDPQALSHADARGLMQLLPFTASRVTGTEDVDLYDPAANIDLGTRFLRYLLDYYRGDALPSLAAYNADERAVKRWRPPLLEYEDDEFVEAITYPETRDYVKRVSANARQYRRLMGLPVE